MVHPPSKALFLASRASSRSALGGLPSALTIVDIWPDGHALRLIVMMVAGWVGITTKNTTNPPSSCLLRRPLIWLSAARPLSFSPIKRDVSPVGRGTLLQTFLRSVWRAPKPRPDYLCRRLAPPLARSRSQWGHLSTPFLPLPLPYGGSSIDFDDRVVIPFLEGWERGGF